MIINVFEVNLQTKYYYYFILIQYINSIINLRAISYLNIISVIIALRKTLKSKLTIFTQQIFYLLLKYEIYYFTDKFHNKKLKSH